MCPVCRSMQPLIMGTGKVGAHGKTAASPRGCPGRGEAPTRKSSLRSGGATVVGMRAGDAGPVADPGLPEIAIEPRVEAMSDQEYARRLARDPDARGGGGDVG